MADSKISALPAATTPLAGTEVLPVVQGGDTEQVSVANLTAGRDVSVKKLNATDNVVIGTAGKGIDFSANTHAPGMTSELLNDYEEGTWTPADASGAGLSLTVSSATYTKIGRMVTAQFDITYPATADTSTQVLGGLPFVPSSATFGGFVSYTTHGSALNLMVYEFSGSGFVSFRQAAGGSNNNNAAYSGNVIRGVLVYFV